jgi:hypothetical protein
MKFFYFFLLLWVIFALLDPDPIGIRVQIRNPGGAETRYTYLTAYFFQWP